MDLGTTTKSRIVTTPTLPPRSPKLRGTVDRANRTHTEEFYEVTIAEPALEAFQVEVGAWEAVFNTVRPDESLGYLTPAEFLASLGIDVQRRCRTSTGTRRGRAESEYLAVE